MITRHFPVSITMQYPTNKDFDLNNIIFFDIETTGFSADMSYLYLIGCIYYKDSSFYIKQWFSENINEEISLITAFFEFIKTYTTLIHYNGTTFDIPYLLKKCSKFELEYSFDHMESIDLYKIISRYKKIFSFHNLRQKTIEAFLGISREDTFSGGDLIQVYQSYLGKKHYETLKKLRIPNAFCDTPVESETLLQQLLLHNEDDIKGLILICPSLAYADLFEKPFHILQVGVDGSYFAVQFELSAKLPVRINVRKDNILLYADQKTAKLSIQVFEGELKHYYENYKDYYYLSKEDCAIHKSLAQYVDKEFREKAKPSNCYTKKQGIFVPQYEVVLDPYFKMKHSDQLSFLEVHTDLLLQEENLESYVKHLLAYIINSK